MPKRKKEKILKDFTIYIKITTYIVIFTWAILFLIGLIFDFIYK